jgi:hypothetical protein
VARIVVLALVMAAVTFPAYAADPSVGVVREFLAGSLGSAVAWAAGPFAGRALATAFDLDSRPVQKDLVTLASCVAAVTAGTSLAVIAAASSLGIGGSNVLCAGGAFLGMPIGMLVEPALAHLVPVLLSRRLADSPLLGTAVEALGAASMLLLPALLATIGFNLGATER